MHAKLPSATVAVVAEHRTRRQRTPTQTVTQLRIC